MSAAKSSRNTGLGRAFDTLLPSDFDKSLLLDPNEKVQKVAIDLLEANKNQPRRNFDKESLKELSQSIKQHGILQPLIVTRVKGKDNYMIIAGERRWRAAKEAGLTSLPAIVRSAKTLEQLEIALVENVQRVDLSPLEQASSINKLHQQFNLTINIIAKRLGKATSTINNTARLIQLPESAQTALRENKITEGHARSILALKGHISKQQELLESIIRNHWSVRQAERFVTLFKSGEPNTDTKDIKKRMRTETPQTKKLSSQLSTPVKIRLTAHGGKLEIDFKSPEDLGRILKNLLGSKSK